VSRQSHPQGLRRACRSSGAVSTSARGARRRGCPCPTGNSRGKGYRSRRDDHFRLGTTRGRPRAGACSERARCIAGLTARARSGISGIDLVCGLPGGSPGPGFSLRSTPDHLSQTRPCCCAGTCNADARCAATGAGRPAARRLHAHSPQPTTRPPAPPKRMLAPGKPLTRQGRLPYPAAAEQGRFTLDVHTRLATACACRTLIGRGVRSQGREVSCARRSWPGPRAAGGTARRRRARAAPAPARAPTAAPRPGRSAQTGPARGRRPRRAARRSARSRRAAPAPPARRTRLARAGRGAAVYMVGLGLGPRPAGDARAPCERPLGAAMCLLASFHCRSPCDCPSRIGLG